MLATLYRMGDVNSMTPILRFRFLLLRSVLNLGTLMLTNAVRLLNKVKGKFVPVLN
jgi:hypothetical protein